jgi:hypothetical protein
MIVNNFGGFGGTWEDYCDKTYPEGAVDKDGKSLREKCRKWGVFEPWTLVGKAERGLPVTWSAIKTAASDVAATAQEVFTPVSDPAPVATSPGAPSAVPYTAGRRTPGAFQPLPGAYVVGEDIASAVKGISAPMVLGVLAGAAGLYYFLKK